MTSSSAEQILAPFISVLRDCVVDGFKDYHREYAHVSYKHNPRTRACAVHDHIVHYVRDRFANSSSIRKIPVKIRNLFDVDGKLVLQFKKLSRRLKTSNIPTLLALSFDNKHTLELPGIPASLPRLSLGYVARSDWTDVEGVYITYMLNRKLIWHIDVTARAGNAPSLFSVPEQPISIPKKRIRAKSTRKSSDGDSSAVAV